MHGQCAVRVQAYDDVTAPCHVVAVGLVLAPVAAPGLLAELRRGHQDPGHAEEVRGLPCVHAGLGRLAVLGEGVAGLGVQLLDLLGRLGEGVGGAQDSGAVGHRPLDREAGLGAEQRVLGGLGVRHRVRHARVQAVGRAGGRDVGHDALGVDQAFEE